jgi:hypothetical protein
MVNPFGIRDEELKYVLRTFLKCFSFCPVIPRIFWVNLFVSFGENPVNNLSE